MPATPRETKQVSALRMLRGGNCTVAEVAAALGCSDRTVYRAQCEFRSIEKVERIDRLEERVRTLEAQVRNLTE
jgi:hypothetical protein